MPSRVRKYIRKGMTVAQTAGKALAIAESVAGLLNTEEHIDDSSLTATPTQTGTLGSLAMPAQGVGSDDRQGDQIRLKSLHFNGKLSIHASATVSVVRIIIIVDKCNTITSIAQAMNSTYTGTARAPYATFNRDTRQNFRVLMDRTYQLESGTNELIHFKFNKRWKKGPIVEFNEAASTVSSNAVKVIFLSDSTTNNPSFDCVTRTTYVDN